MWKANLPEEELISCMRLAEHEQKKGADEERNGGSEERERERAKGSEYGFFPFNCINRDLGDFIDNMPSWVLADGQN